MEQGTGSDVGKSLIVAALCRIARRRGIRVAPFKPQNMIPTTRRLRRRRDRPAPGTAGPGRRSGARSGLHPVLLKPETDRRAQVIVRGKVIDSMEAADYMARRGARWTRCSQFERLVNAYELIVVKAPAVPPKSTCGKATSPTLGFARRGSGIPVCLVGDIDKGGVIASSPGTQAVLSPPDAAMIRGFVINKFRGDPRCSMTA